MLIKAIILIIMNYSCFNFVKSEGHAKALILALAPRGTYCMETVMRFLLRLARISLFILCFLFLCSRVQRALFPVTSNFDKGVYIFRRSSEDTF